jgi:multicomponent K+:H+ antiporter subunit E
MLARLFPHPVLSLVVAVVWLMLANDLSPGHVLLAIAFGVAVPKLTAAYWPDRPPLRRPATVLEYCLVVLWDIIVSNIQVAYLVLFRRGDSLRSRYITMTPGTVSADLSADGRALLVHCLDTDDPEGTVAQIKQRYERRLKEIFS